MLGDLLLCSLALWMPAQQELPFGPSWRSKIPPRGCSSPGSSRPNTPESLTLALALSYTEHHWPGGDETTHLSSLPSQPQAQLELLGAQQGWEHTTRGAGGAATQLWAGTSPGLAHTPAAWDRKGWPWLRPGLCPLPAPRDTQPSTPSPPEASQRIKAQRPFPHRQLARVSRCSTQAPGAPGRLQPSASLARQIFFTPLSSSGTSTMPQAVHKSLPELLPPQHCCQRQSLPAAASLLSLQWSRMQINTSEEINWGKKAMIQSK